MNLPQLKADQSPSTSKVCPSGLVRGHFENNPAVLSKGIQRTRGMDYRGIPVLFLFRSGGFPEVDRDAVLTLHGLTLV